MKKLNKESGYWDLQPLHTYLSLQKPDNLPREAVEGVRDALIAMIKSGEIECEWEVGKEPDFITPNHPNFGK